MDRLSLVADHSRGGDTAEGRARNYVADYRQQVSFVTNRIQKTIDDYFGGVI